MYPWCKKSFKFTSAKLQKNTFFCPNFRKLLASQRICECTTCIDVLSVLWLYLCIHLCITPCITCIFWSSSLLFLFSWSFSIPLYISIFFFSLFFMCLCLCLSLFVSVSFLQLCIFLWYFYIIFSSSFFYVYVSVFVSVCLSVSVTIFVSFSFSVSVNLLFFSIFRIWRDWAGGSQDCIQIFSSESGRYKIFFNKTEQYDKSWRPVWLGSAESAERCEALVRTRQYESAEYVKSRDRKEIMTNSRMLHSAG